MPSVVITEFVSPTSSLVPELWHFQRPLCLFASSNFQVERDYDREEKDDYESDREDSVTLSEDMTSSPCAQHNGSYKTHNEEDASMGADSIKWLLHHHGN